MSSSWLRSELCAWLNSQPLESVTTFINTVENKESREYLIHVLLYRLDENMASQVSKHYGITEQWEDENNMGDILVRSEYLFPILGDMYNQCSNMEGFKESFIADIEKTYEYLKGRCEYKSRDTEEFLNKIESIKSM